MSQRERIIEQTARMFVELGIKSIRMDDIAHTLGISKRTLYEMFTDKEELIYLCMKYLMDEQLRMVAETTADCDDKLEALFNGFKLMLDGGERHHRMMTNLQKFYPAVFDRIRVEHIRGGVSRLREVILSYIDFGLINSNINVDLSITIFYYTATGVFGQRNNIILPEGVTEKGAFMYTIVNFFRGIATEEGVRQIDRLVKEKKLYDF
ncbi:MAG: TetR/AcrR family transcriptional regulator [Alistipes sp.]|jgi:transcriptional regulator|nr:TetR/AcrR family transcriptional regulator [Alistipes sp.]